MTDDYWIWFKVAIMIVAMVLFIYILATGSLDKSDEFYQDCMNDRGTIVKQQGGAISCIYPQGVTP